MIAMAKQTAIGVGMAGMRGIGMAATTKASVTATDYALDAVAGRPPIRFDANGFSEPRKPRGLKGAIAHTAVFDLGGTVVVLGVRTGIAALTGNPMLGALAGAAVAGVLLSVRSRF